MDKMILETIIDQHGNLNVPDQLKTLAGQRVQITIDTAFEDWNKPGETAAWAHLQQKENVTLQNAFGQPIGFPVPDWKVPPSPPREPMQGKYCRLEPLNPDLHAKDLFEANALDKEGRNWTYLFDEPPKTFEEYVERLHKMALGNDPLFFTIVLNETNKAVGVASYLRITPSAGSIEVGSINFSPLLQRTPAATEAMYLMMKNAFDLRYRRYEWKCDALNAPSRTAAQRLGFSYEGIFRQALVYKGRNRDTAWYAVIDKEWGRLEAAFQQWLDPANFDENGKQRVALRDLTRVQGAGYRV
jgi:RimJ/RimL family protein N-acetyltransferase